MKSVYFFGSIDIRVRSSSETSVNLLPDCTALHPIWQYGLYYVLAGIGVFFRCVNV
jgi:hypothetical protein